MSAQLVIDTSTSRTSVGLISHNKVIWSEYEDGAIAHAEAVPRLVQRALAQENNISEVIVGMGPGPYTGLRSEDTRLNSSHSRASRMPSSA